MRSTDALHRRGGKVIILQIVQALRNQLAQVIRIGAPSLYGQMVAVRLQDQTGYH
jgi:hypothetical protein